MTVVLRVAPLVVFRPRPRSRPRKKNYSRGRLRMNLKATPKARGLDIVARL